MLDIVKVMTDKRLDLQKRKQRMEETHRQVIANVDKQINEIDLALAKINEYIEPYVCPKCKGSGFVKVCDAAGDMDEEPCHICGGTGLKPPEEALKNAT